jgi:hypothetical protein
MPLCGIVPPLQPQRGLTPLGLGYKYKLFYAFMAEPILRLVFYAEHRRLGVHIRLGLIKPILRLVFYAKHKRLGVPFFKKGGCI